MKMPGLRISLMMCTTLAANAQTATTKTNQPANGGHPTGAVMSRFTFGTPTSVTRAGFSKVTVKDKFAAEKGFGFESTAGLLAFDRGGWEIVRPRDEYTASVYGAYRTTSDLTCALIEGTTNNAFIVALPDGDYSVWLIASDAEWDPPLFEVWADGQKKLDLRIPRRAFVFMEAFQARATDGRLKIGFKGPHGWIVSALVIGKEGPALTEMIAEINKDIFFLTKPELPNWKEVKHESANPPLEWSPAEQQKGYVVFPVDYTEQMTPASVPTRSAIGRPVTAFATPDEFEPASVCVSARVDLGAVKLEVGSFTDEKTKHIIAPENVDVGVVRCWPRRESSWGTKGNFLIVPEMIEPPGGRASRVGVGQLKQWWLTVHVPPNTPAGRYRMPLTVRPEKGPPTDLEFRLLVLPFELTRPADKHWGTWLESFPPVGGLRGPERRGRNTPAEEARLVRADLVDYRNHGFDLAIFNFYFGVKENLDGDFEYDISALTRTLDYWKTLGSATPVAIGCEYTFRNLEYGFAEPGRKHVPGTFSPKARQAIIGLVRHIHEEAARRNWPRLYFYPIDEPGNNKTENRMQFAQNVLDLVHAVPGCKTATTVGAGDIQRLGARVDARIYAYGDYNRKKVLQETQQGHPFWYYDNGMFYGHSTSGSRNMTGFEFLRSGAEVATAWGFDCTKDNPDNDFDGGHKDWNVVFPGVDKLTPTIYWELCREGVDDCRYVATLQQQIGEAKTRGQTAAAERAERILRALIDPDAPGIESPLAFSRYRWRIAREILALRQNRQDRELALPFAAVADNPPAPTRLGSNVVANHSFEAPAQADGTPPGRFYLGYPKPNEKPVGALLVTDEAAHSGRFSLKWDLSKVADPAATGRDPRWVVVNVGFDPQTVKSLRGKRVKVGYWMRLGGGQTVPGLGLRQTLKEGSGDAFFYRGGVTDPAAWNHFETEGRLSNRLESMDIHTWCTVPEAELAKASFFFIDDISLQMIEEPPLSISTPLEEYYVGEEVRWKLTAVPGTAAVNIQFLMSNRVVSEQAANPAAGQIQGEFETSRLQPGLYTLRAITRSGVQAPVVAQHQLILAPNPFDWPPLSR
jgi:hypothetical protein